MKFLSIFTILSACVYLCAALSSSDVCEWQTARNNLIAKLSPTGQATANKILAQLQYYTGAAIQPLYEFIRVKYSTFINSLGNTPDNQRLALLGTSLGYGNYSSGAGPVRDSCQDAKDLDNLINSFSASAKPTVLNMLNDFNTGVFYGYKSVIAISNLLDAPLYQQMQKENSTILNQLYALYGY